MRKKIFAAGLLLSAPWCMADNPKLIALLNDDSTVTIEIEEGQYKQSYTDGDGGALNVTVEKYDENNQLSTVFSMPLASMKGFDFQKGSGIKNLQTDKVAYKYSDGVFHATNISEPVEIYITSTDGIVRYHDKVTTDTSVDMNAFGAGTYVVSVGKSSFKIMVTNH